MSAVNVIDVKFLRQLGKFISGILLLFIWFFAIIPVFAANSQFLVHWRPPEISKKVIKKGKIVKINLLVKNISNNTFSTVICATDMVGGRSFHLGCLPKVDFSPRGSTSKFNFTVSQKVTIGGFHVVVFNYQDPQGRWLEILDTRQRASRATFWVK